MRVFSVICFAIAILTMIIGAFFAGFNFLIDWDFYFKLVAIVSSVASIFGLLGLMTNPLKNTDLNRLSSDSLMEVAKNAKEIQEKQKEIKEAEDQINELTIKKKDLEVLVEQASLGIFYNKALNKAYETLSELVESKNDIKEVINEIQKLEKDLNDLNIKAEENKEIKDILEILQKADNMNKRSFLDTLFESVAASLIPLPK